MRRLDPLHARADPVWPALVSGILLFTSGASILAGSAAATLALDSATAPPPQDAFARVPEAEDYTLVYDLDVPVSASFNVNGVPYRVDRGADLAEPFDRVAYYLELVDDDGASEWLYVSMRAFTPDAAKLGVPHRGSGAQFQRAVHDLNVYSNVAAIETGAGLGGGNIEFWPTNYATGNVARVPGASDDIYDTGDAPVAAGGYGSMQVHRPAAGQTLFAYNRWGASNAASDIGIGNRPPPPGASVVHTDWTFSGSAGAYAARRLQVLVRPRPTPLELLIEQPTSHAVFQRDAYGAGRVRVRLLAGEDAQRVEARARVVQGFSGTAAGWRPIATRTANGRFEGELQLLGGWYEIDIRAVDTRGGTSSATVGPVGVGEVFVTAGQSNSANHGSPRLAPADARVTAYGPGGWRPAADPQPIATGGGGSPWPALGDFIAARYDVPVGFISVGWGGTRVEQWLPGLQLYPRLRDALGIVGPRGPRAVLWHQGESDAGAGTPAELYAQRLSAVIAQSRADAGFAVPWGVALVGFLPNGNPDRMAAVVEGQRAAIAADPLVFEGPTTDDLVGPEWRHDSIHFNEAGLREHARRWAERIPIPTLMPTATPTGTPTSAPSLGRAYLPVAQQPVTSVSPAP